MKNFILRRNSIVPASFLGEGALLFLVRDKAGLLVEPHHHIYHELDYILDGVGEYAVGRHIQTVKAGSLIHIGPGILHRRESSIEHPLAICNLVVADALIRGGSDSELLWPLWRVWNLEKAVCQDGKKAIAGLLRLMPSKGKAPLLLNPRQWRKLSPGLRSIFAHDRIQSSNSFPCLCELASRVRSDPEKNYSLSKEATRYRVGRFWLSRSFHKAFGMPLIEYRDFARTEKAIKLLLHSDIAIGELWGRLGYSSKSHFINTFKRLVGMTPQAFRRCHSSGKAV